MLRRKDNYVPELLELEGTVLNRSTYELICRSKSCALSGKEYQLLEMFMEKPFTIISTEQLLTHIWGWNTEVDSSVVWVHISNIRKKAARVGASIQIRFVRNAGYILEKKPEAER